ncbi:MAG TPA: ABC transporter substrate-binding protein [Thermoanaerobaculia bacterium]|nr:ABC transporter substrate-binding protein [Thermoanaerobaculia bacterium]
MKKLCGALFVCLALACRGREHPVVVAPRPAPSPVPEPVLGYIDESSAGAAVEGGVLRRRLLGEPTTLNAVLQSGLPEQQVLQYLSRNLLDFDSRMILVPGLAERYEVSADGREFRFTLRADAIWEDGAPVTAADAVFTLKRITDPKVPSPVFKPVFEDLVSVEALDRRTFVARFREVYPYRAMAFVLPLLPERRFAGKPFAKARENRAPLSDGPYRLVSWNTQQSIELERNRRYWGPPAHFDRVLLRILPENAVAYRSLLAGELDETILDQSAKERAARDPDFAACCRLVEFYNLDYNYIALNNRTPFFSDARVRRAMTMLLDRAAIVRSLFKGSARIISGPWAPDSPAYDARVPPLPFDPAAAARLLDEAGWRDTDGDGIRDRGGRAFEFELLVSSGSDIGRQIDESLAGQLARVGIAARVRPMEWASFVERIDAGDFEAASLAGSASDPNPDPYPYWHSSQWPPRGLNSGFYRNPEADRLMEEARAEKDDQKRLKIYHRLHALLRDDAPAIFVNNASAKYGFRRRVRGLVTSPLGFAGIWPGPVGWWASDAAAPHVAP